jgi:hypothetical protein
MAVRGESCQERESRRGNCWPLSYLESWLFPTRAAVASCFWFSPFRNRLRGAQQTVLAASARTIAPKLQP